MTQRSVVLELTVSVYAARFFLRLGGLSPI